ncbi:anamorsin homolog [Striga asiatica]|uniref:Anamorsin homolog n=1 Tax=Striga asiatica TaxID=4170 RepID=A0A5A7QT74_STRAF|nr:anamorsin homolog [Striga asiatica]
MKQCLVSTVPLPVDTAGYIVDDVQLCSIGISFVDKWVREEQLGFGYSILFGQILGYACFTDIIVDLSILGKKPTWKIGSSFSIKKSSRALPKVQIDDDVDFIDEDSLLTEEDLKKPQLPPVGDCEVGSTKKACKNCTCGREEKCGLGDVFGCGTCPYNKGLPPFKLGEKLLANISRILKPDGTILLYSTPETSQGHKIPKNETANEVLHETIRPNGAVYREPSMTSAAAGIYPDRVGSRPGHSGRKMGRIGAKSPGKMDGSGGRTRKAAGSKGEMTWSPTGGELLDITKSLGWLHNVGKKQSKSLYLRIRAEIKRAVKGSKKQVKFQYDPHSYSLNFDDGFEYQETVGFEGVKFKGWQERTVWVYIVFA